MTLAAMALVLAARSYQGSWARGAAALEIRHRAMRLGADCLALGDAAPAACLRQICWDPELARSYARPLREVRLGPFADR
jgi:hypothetical protein